MEFLPALPPGHRKLAFGSACAAPSHGSVRRRVALVHRLLAMTSASSAVALSLLVMERRMSGRNVGYTCYSCAFRTNVSNCDSCDGVIRWDRDGHAYCSGCKQQIVRTTCRKCGNRFSL